MDNRLEQQRLILEKYLYLGEGVEKEKKEQERQEVRNRFLKSREVAKSTVNSKGLKPYHRDLQKRE
jgi:hypothetical protein